ncbi:14272_t:CDS:10 [Entrophospora sp. SA101]|nr:14272_t:CDS:10 [Entrophospora sp. SA101]
MSDNFNHGIKNKLAALYQQAFQLAKQAVEEDHNGNKEIARNSYLEVLKIFDSIIKIELDQDAKKILSKYQEYSTRIKQIDAEIISQLSDQAQSILDLAVIEDEKKNYQEALDLYFEAVQLLLDIRRKSKDQESKSELSNKINYLLKRAEDLKGLPKKTMALLNNPGKGRLSFYSPGSGLKKEEIEILKNNSVINAVFGEWKRPSEIMKQPRMIVTISSETIKQDMVDDCSFVASLCVSAEYERRFQKQVVTGCIYPQDDKGQPIYNPIIDDLLPISNNGKPLYTYSKGNDELWPCIIEKAETIFSDALTGWIPEIFLIEDEEFEKEHTWNKLLNGQRNGHALVTIATGKEESKLICVGLFTAHCYAVLDVQEIGGLRLLRVKNPWHSQRWNGNFSHLDGVNWTPYLMNILNYNRAKAINDDDGIFWIDYDSVCTYFDTIYMNWDPNLFDHKYVIHYLRVDNKNNKPSAVCILLSKHIKVTEEDERYITFHLFNNTNGKKVYYPTNPLKKVRFDAPKGKSKYTVVVGLKDKSKPLDFTLRCYSESSIILNEIPKQYPIEYKKNDQWTSQTAGGNPGIPTYLNNPQYQSHDLFMIQVEMIWNKGKRVTNYSLKDILVKSHGYRQGFCYCEVDDVKYGDYTIVVSAYTPNDIGEFTLTVASNVEFKVTSIPNEGAGLFKEVIKGQWIRLQTTNVTPIPSINIKIFEQRGNNLFSKEVATSGDYIDSPQGVCTDEITLPPYSDGYVVVFSTWDKNISCQFIAYFYTDRNVTINEIIKI